MSELSIEELRKTRIVDMTLGDLERSLYRLKKAHQITMSFKDFCETINRNETTVRNHLRVKHYPERLIVGGYTKKKGNDTRFMREEVELWLKTNR